MHCGQQVRRDPRGREARRAAGQGHGEDQLVGQVRVARGVALEETEEGIHCLVCHPFGRLPPLSHGGESGGNAPCIGHQHQEAPRPGRLRLHQRDVGLASLGLEPPQCLFPLPLRNVPREVRHGRQPAEARRALPGNQVGRAQLCAALDRDVHPPAPLGVESPPQQLQVRRYAHLAQDREPHLAHVMDGGTPGDVGSPGQDDPRRAGCLRQGKQDGLEDQRRRAGRPHVELIFAPLDGARRELHPLRAERRAIHLRAADLGQRAHGRKMLRLQARMLPPGADRVDLDRHTADRGQGQGGAQDLPAPLSLGSINSEHRNARIRHGVSLHWKMANRHLTTGRPY